MGPAYLVSGVMKPILGRSIELSEGNSDIDLEEVTEQIYLELTN